MLRTSRGRGVWQGLGLLALAVVVLSVAGCSGSRVVAGDPCDPCQKTCDPCGNTPPCGPCGIPAEVKPGEAWCRVWVPPTYATKVDTVCVEPARQERKRRHRRSNSSLKRPTSPGSADTTRFS